jgi:DNA-binding NarL/FixJ family response regulator
MKRISESADKPRRMDVTRWFKGQCPRAKIWRTTCFSYGTGRDPKTELKESDKKPMINLNDIKITPRDQQVLRLLVQGCSNKEIASHLSISPRTVKQHLRTLFLRAGIKEGRKRVKLATAMFIKEQASPCNPVIG